MSFFCDAEVEERACDIKTSGNFRCFIYSRMIQYITVKSMNGHLKRYLSDNLPFFFALTPAEQETLFSGTSIRAYAHEELIYSGRDDCAGLYLVQAGELRAYIISESGRELTLFRLFEYDICLFSASCLLSGIDFDLWVKAKAQTRVLLISNTTFNELLKNINVLDYTNRLLTSRFNDIMFLINQLVFSRFDKRLADFLLEQSSIVGGNNLAITHEEVANNIGSAREVVTRMLQYFQSENIIRLSRGRIAINDFRALKNISDSSPNNKKRPLT